MSENNIFKSLIDNKKVLFISTKNSDYLRNTQEIEIIEQSAKSLKILAYKDKSYLKRIIKIYLRCFKVIFSDKYDVIFVGFAPQLLLPFLNAFSRKSTLIIDFFISCYDTLVFDRRKFKENSFIAKIIHWIDKKTIENSDFVIADTKEHQKYFIKEFGLLNEKTEVLYLKADTSIYYPREQIKATEFQDKFIVLYFGSILPLQGVDVVLKSAEILADNADIHFYIIGPLSDSQLVQYGPLKNVTHYKWLSQEELALKISEADLCLAGHFCNDIEKAKRTIPGKAYIYKAMQKPMILGDGPANHELYPPSEKDGNYYVPMGDAQKLAECILSVKESSKANENR